MIQMSSYSKSGTPEQKISQLPIGGGIFGVKIAVIASGLYGSPFIVLGFLDGSFIENMGRLFLTLLVILVLGMIPAAIVGFVTGALLGVALRLTYTKIDNLGAATIPGLLVTTMLTAIIHLLLVPNFISTLGSYLFWLGIPSLIYVFLGAWTSRVLYKRYLM